MANNQGQKPGLDCYVVIHVATTCDEHGVFVTKDSAEVIELGWILLDATSCDEVRIFPSSRRKCTHQINYLTDLSRERPREASEHSNNPTLQ